MKSTKEKESEYCKYWGNLNTKELDKEIINWHQYEHAMLWYVDLGFEEWIAFNIKTQDPIPFHIASWVLYGRLDACKDVWLMQG